MSSATKCAAPCEEYPRRASLRKMMSQNPLPFVPPGTVDAASMTPETIMTIASAVVDAFNTAIDDHDVPSIAATFSPQQAFFKDTLAMTGYYRTFNGAGVIAPVLLHLSKLRGLKGAMAVDKAEFVPATPVLQYIDIRLSFKTTSPAATNKAMMLVLPISKDGDIQWKIWILTTYLQDLDLHPENEALLQQPGRDLKDIKNVDSDVLIIGAGNAAVTLAARLKTLGVDAVLLERNAKSGDNWRLRYDCMRFHLPTEFCDLPYLPYPTDLQSPHMLTRDELADHVEGYVETFHLNVIYSANITLTTYDPKAKKWTVTFQTPDGEITATCKHLVQATGFGSQKPHKPVLAEREPYKGTSIHSAKFKNGTELKANGAKSVLIVGSANTAFDVMEDCHNAGLTTIMNVRSPTFILPLDYVCDNRALGAYIHGVTMADNRYLTLPTCIESHFIRGLFSMLASQEPDRYQALSDSGFPVVCSDDPEAILSSNLLERAGGHYVDMGTTKLLADGSVGIKANTEPVAYTSTGVEFSDKTTLDVDAIIWCTGFADQNARETLADILGQANCKGALGAGLLGPKDIGARVDATWGLDDEGEVRGMWKRQLAMENFWIMGGFTSLHRWHSRFLALQIKADLGGVLPSAYRETPASISAVA